MGGLFGGGPKPPKLPPPVRKPVETDPELEKAGLRAREDARRRSGRLSTLLTDQTRVSGGSLGSGRAAGAATSSQKLGG